MTPGSDPSALAVWAMHPLRWSRSGIDRYAGVAAICALVGPGIAVLACIASLWLLPEPAPATTSLPAMAVWTILIVAPVLPWIGLRAYRVLHDNARLSSRLREADAVLRDLDSVAALVREIGGGIRRWSGGCERLFGFAAHEVIGRRAQEVLQTRFPAGGRRLAQDMLLREGQWNGKLRHRSRDGGIVTVTAHWILQRDAGTGQPTGVLEVYADATSLDAAEAALRAGEARLRLAQEVAAIGTWEWNPEEDSFVLSAEHGPLFGPSAHAGAPRPLDAFLDMVHRDDREAVRAAFSRALECGEYEVEFRVPKHLPDGTGEEEVRWMIGRGRRMPGPIGRVGAVLGVHVDITARKEAEQRQALLMREVDHRAKNALAVVQAVLRLTRADSPDAFARAVEDRIAALSRTHTLLAEASWTGVELRNLLASEFAPFSGAAGAGRIRMEGPLLFVPAVMVQPLSIALHELATNAAKYGALSSPGGRVVISWNLARAERILRLRWSEEAGPPLDGPPVRRGFGSRVIEQTVRRQLGGTAEFSWRPDGLLFEAEIPLQRARAPSPPLPAARAAESRADTRPTVGAA